MAEEVFQPAFLPNPYPLISYNLPFYEAVKRHLGDESIGVRRVYIICSLSLSRGASSLQKLKDALGEDVVGIKVGMKPHTYWSEVIEVTNEIIRSKANTIVTFGGGSLTDAAKVAALAVSNSITSFEALNTIRHDSPNKGSSIKASTISIICIPTTLSGGEYSAFAGASNDKTKHKDLFAHPSMLPKLVILDPKLCRSTPPSVWLSTGIRAVDHCVETICSKDSQEKADHEAHEALKLLLPGLLSSKSQVDDAQPRLQCQLGVLEAMKAVSNGVLLGASHGIGHQLGPLGVGHGETSCILLPAVMRYNFPANKEKQAKVLSVFWEQPVTADLLNRRGIMRGEAQLGDVLDVFISELGMPRSLRQLGINDVPLRELAASSLKDKWCKSNPRPLEREEQVLEILGKIV